ncbi:protocatechuate 3,4-dioxygenase [Pseudomonas sp. PCH199]|uniref:DODA-type extradiol aromatic ring-opening family dioxygenase n=1 Tax=unclassified Pseudomonas TaxID=196821 RepID=UPI000BD31C36|nr:MULTISPECIES: protocatechuate 3,4-dioxygenase [unclassified Pseudomonas]MCW8277783.1 protocatechuate 3,4-dioxygenase [Pseudomonas sp. PCH199]PAM81944.1 protocatechuate 3,4-dioxygenase [Pseudomonas sp. ERMR1:02]
MGKIVGGFWMPHDPVMFVAPNAPPQAQGDAVWGAYEQCAQRLAQLAPTSVIIVGCDHYILFGTQCLPRYVIGTGDVDGPLDRLPGLERGVVRNQEKLAGHIVSHGEGQGIDWTVARSFTVDHSFSIPHQLTVKPAEQILGRELPTIPVYLACGVDPFISLKRAADLGRQIRAAVESFDADERVVIIGSGGISHWVGTAEMGRVAEDFDREILAHGVNGDLQALCAYSDEEILRRAGNGAMEIRNFACAMAAVANPAGQVIAYEAVPAWVTGLGFLQLIVGEEKP